MGTIAARRVSRALRNLERVLAIEVMILVSAMEIRQGESESKRFSEGATIIQQFLREMVGPLREDRPLGFEIEAVSRQLNRQKWIYT